MSGAIEPIVGRYVHLALGGRPHRVYFEEAGDGWPLLCLHTAGADGRQFRHAWGVASAFNHFHGTRAVTHTWLVSCGYRRLTRAL
jgi:hypothetical protein